jgi:plasmid stabilization system protein ParE
LEGTGAPVGDETPVRLERHPAVVAEDLPGIYTSITRDNPTAAERVLDAMEKTFEQLTPQPECGVAYRTRNRNLPDVRMLPVVGFTSYLVFYRIDVEAVQVLYLVQGARYLPRLFRREPRG